MSTREQRIVSSLLLGALGDALGMPWEIQTRAEILERTNGNGVTGFVDPAQIRTDAAWRFGDWTDDTQLSLVVAQSLIAEVGWNPVDCMRRHVVAMEETDAGWGGTTKQAVNAFAQAYAADPELELNLIRPPQSEPGRGGGNGPLMKVAPLALATAAQYGADYLPVLRARVKEISFLTHGDPDVALATYAGARFIAEGVNTPIQTRQAGIALLEQVTREVADMEHEFAVSGYPSLWEVSLHNELAQISDVVSDYDGLLSLCQNETRPFVARTSAVMAIGLFLGNIEDAERGLFEAVSAGGDTDTNAAILGNILGAHGAFQLGNEPPTEMDRFLDTFSDTFLPVLVETGESLAKTFLL